MLFCLAEAESPGLALCTSLLQGFKYCDIMLMSQGYRSAREFIVTQMPLVDTRVDFWRLVDDFCVSTIVMLDDAKEMEVGREDEIVIQ